MPPIFKRLRKRAGKHRTILVLITCAIISSTLLVLSIARTPTALWTKERTWQEQVRGTWQATKDTTSIAWKTALNAGQKGWRTTVTAVVPIWQKTRNTWSRYTEQPIRPPELTEEVSPTKSNEEEIEPEISTPFLRPRRRSVSAIRDDPAEEEIPEEKPIPFFQIDLDGDGDYDSLTAHMPDLSIIWYENNGENINKWKLRYIDSYAHTADALAVGDIDGDGDNDVVAASSSRDQIAWYENNGGHPPSWSRWHITSQGRGIASLSLDDRDGDGDMEVKATSFDGIKVWYINDGKSPTGWVGFIE